MDQPQIDTLLSDQWKSAVSTCCDGLERNDLRQVSVYNSWDDVQVQIVSAQKLDTSHQEFAMLAPALTNLKTFTETWLSKLLPNLDTSIFWGMVRLTIKLTQDELYAITRIPQILRNVCHKMEVFNNYCEEMRIATDQLKEPCVDCARTILSLLFSIVKFLRSDIAYSTHGDLLDNEWKPLAQQVSSTEKILDESVVHLETLSEFTDRSSNRLVPVRELTSSIPQQQRPRGVDDAVRLPCIILPSIRISHFFDRTDVIAKIENHFNASDAFQSLALYGPGGVGKSAVALRYAEVQLREGRLDALFWVYSEKLVSLRQSFTDIALRLKLPDSRLSDHDENHALVLSWLRNTQCRWLIVYDNAENLDLVREHWPVGGQGQALITTRNHSFAFEMADGGLEVKTWDAQTGSKFLLHLLSTDIGTEVGEDDTASAHELSKKLSGHALAISHMAGLIHRRAWSIAEFMKIYDQHQNGLDGVSGSIYINAIWDLSFQSLNTDSFAILGVLSFVAPDSVPQALFEPENAADLPASLAFCSDHLRFPEAIESLLTLALIKRDKDSRTLSLHRLVQTSFKYFLTKEQRIRSFNDACVLVSWAFPRCDSKTAQLYLLWSRCALYLQHVISLKDCFREEVRSNPNITALKTYCDLNNACQRYLLETNAYTELEDLIAVNTIAFSTLSQEDQTVALQASLTSHTGQLFVRLGKGAEGIPLLLQSYDIRSRDKPFKPQESAWAAENVAQGIATMNNYTEAIKWQEQARDHWLSWSNVQVEEPGVWPICIKKTLGMILCWAGFLERSREVTKLALQQSEASEPFNWAMAAYSHYTYGTIERAERNYESAEAHFMEAQNLWLKGDQLRTDPFNAACMYRLGCVSLDQGKVEAATKHLRDALVVTDMRKNTMPMDHARCLYKLSEALEQDTRCQTEAQSALRQAEQILFHYDPQGKARSLERTYDEMVYISWR